MLPNELSSHFLTWQCRIRQMAMREAEGRPSPGMCPKVLDGEGNVLADRVVILLIRENPLESTDFLKFQVQKHNAPEDVYKKALIYLQSTHYHRAIEFSDEMTALFSPDSALVERLLIEGKCVLEFEQYGQHYSLPCRVRQLEKSESSFQATIWHNRVFNPNLSGEVAILGFQPDWDEAADQRKNRRIA